MTPAYVKLASEILRLWQASLEAGLIAHPRDVSSGAPAAAADLNGLGRRQDPFGEPFAEGTFVGKLESDEAGEEGLYNVVLLRHPRTAYSFALATKDPHPSAEPARAPFYIHAHRLLLAVEDALSPSGEKGVAAFDKGADAGDGNGGRKRFIFHFASAEQQASASSAVKSAAHALPSPSSLAAELPALLERALPKADEPYNAVLTAGELIVFPRAKGQAGIIDGERLDGGALYGPF